MRRSRVEVDDTAYQAAGFGCGAVRQPLPAAQWDRVTDAASVAAPVTPRTPPPAAAAA
ncbi:hypothetical protein GCM10011594_09240 [Nakamurella endophytica]|uniref:Uncharacterized protein n=1 Tax=Nakamurella endophytica TaxID=1748367 RepID=A0A917SP82_9ACTN|nr:hypothetical protein GCM10011594_09240 [Nakamurella endophytica]